MRQYIGKRYVPLFYENPEDGSCNWLSGQMYEALTVVLYGNTSYTSKKDVPATVGAPNANPDYWVATGNYQAQIGSLVEDMQQVQSDLVTQGGEIDELDGRVGVLEQRSETGGYNWVGGGVRKYVRPLKEGEERPIQNGSKEYPYSSLNSIWDDMRAGIGPYILCTIMHSGDSEAEWCSASTDNTEYLEVGDVSGVDSDEAITVISGVAPHFVSYSASVGGSTHYANVGLKFGFTKSASTSGTNPRFYSCHPNIKHLKIWSEVKDPTLRNTTGIYFEGCSVSLEDVEFVSSRVTLTKCSFVLKNVTFTNAGVQLDQFLDISESMGVLNDTYCNITNPIPSEKDYITIGGGSVVRFLGKTFAGGSTSTKSLSAHGCVYETNSIIITGEAITNFGGVQGLGQPSGSAYEYPYDEDHSYGQQLSGKGGMIMMGARTNSNRHCGPYHGAFFVTGKLVSEIA